MEETSNGETDGMRSRKRNLTITWIYTETERRMETIGKDKDETEGRKEEGDDAEKKFDDKKELLLAFPSLSFASIFPSGGPCSHF